MNTEAIINYLKNYIKEVEEDIEELSKEKRYTKIIAYGHLSRIGLLADTGIIDSKEYKRVVDKIRRHIDISDDDLIEASFLTTNY